MELWHIFQSPFLLHSASLDGWIEERAHYTTFVFSPKKSIIGKQRAELGFGAGVICVLNSPLINTARQSKELPKSGVLHRRSLGAGVAQSLALTALTQTKQTFGSSSPSALVFFPSVLFLLKLHTNSELLQTKSPEFNTTGSSSGHQPRVTPGFF